MQQLVKSKLIMKLETARFIISYVHNESINKSEIILEGKTAGRHRAKHSSVEVLDDKGNLLEIRSINEEIAKFILKYFEQRGDTESFRIYKSDLDLNTLQLRNKTAKDPKNIIHVVTEAERSFTANGSKLWFHKPIFDKYKETGYGSVIRATLTNHQVCASSCQFCSTIARNKKDSVTLQEAKDFVDQLYFQQAEHNQKYFQEYNEQYKKSTGSDIRLKGLILSGGGQPNLWPHFSDLVDYLSSLDISLGLITNGFPKNINEDIYKNFDWIRISITPESASPFYPGGRFDKQYIPSTIINNPNLTVGYSYVYGPWTNDGLLKRISDSINELGFDYCRTLTDCNLSRDAQLEAHEELSKRLNRLGFIDSQGNPTGRIFHQLKYHGTQLEADNLWEDGQCYLQTYNVFWDTTGHEENGHSYCYACDSVTVLTNNSSDGNITASERKFNYDKWGTVKNTEVSRLFTEPVKPFFDPKSICSSCLFMRNNQVVKDIINSEYNSLVNLNTNIQHINFP